MQNRARFESQILKNGHITIPTYLRKKLGLMRGSKLTLAIEKVSHKKAGLKKNSLRNMIGLCEEGGKKNGSSNHDRYLYLSKD
jgi:bifunctional DNA-binding transcriptional regulator/antitoxin component of YhaV-PrlF toxin-antitoxin module